MYDQRDLERDHNDWLESQTDVSDGLDLSSNLLAPNTDYRTIANRTKRLNVLKEIYRSLHES